MCAFFFASSSSSSFKDDDDNPLSLGFNLMREDTRTKTLEESLFLNNEREEKFLGSPLKKEENL